jgi:pimeloyl-ACP methyl ester carboxylesterase
MIATLPYGNGMALSYAQYGDPNGAPVLVQHGLIASIQDSGLFKRLTGAGRRVICIARPGYGASSPYGMANMAEWGQMAARLVDALHLPRFDVLGISSGAPYSYAIAACLPQKVRTVYILSGTPALFDAQVLARWPYPVNPQAGQAELEQLAYDLFFAWRSAEDLRQDDVRDAMMNHCFGIAQDLRLRCNDWGFRLGEISSRVVMRHSRADDSVPLATAELTARMFPNCHLEIHDRDPHFSPAVLDDFIGTVLDGENRTK